MNAPSAGWHADPTRRHEYRYWDGQRWTDDVSDSGVTSVDPVDGPGAAGGPGADPTAPVDTTQPYRPQPGGYGVEPGEFAAPGVPGGPPAGVGGGPGGFGPMPGGGPVPPAGPGRRGPSKGLVVGLVVLAVALIAGVAFALTKGGDDEDDTTDIASDDTTSTTGDSSDDTSGSGSAAAGDDGVIDLIANGIEMGAEGKITHDQAVCMAEAMVDHFGLENLMEMTSTSGEDWLANASAEDQAAFVELLTDCVPADVLIDLGMSQQDG